MNFYRHSIGDYRRDTHHLTLLEHGIYRQMLDQYYLDENPLNPDLDALMRSLCVRTADEQQSFKNVLKDFFKLTKNGYIHKRCEAELQRIYDKSDKARQSAKRRWGKDNQEDTCERNANASKTHSDRNANGMLPSNLVTHNPKENTTPLNILVDPTGSSRKQGSRLPDDWELPDKCREWAIAQGCTRVQAEVDKFRDYWRSVPGAKGRKADWEATWRNWIRKAMENMGGGNGSHQQDTRSRAKRVSDKLDEIALRDINANGYTAKLG
jgi:uncharacterized protein YdaU (DUF1376 family)